MNRLLCKFLIPLVCLIPACVPARQYIDLESREINAPGNQLIVVQVDYGELSIRQSEDERVITEGQVLFDDKLEYQVDTANERILVKVFVHRNITSEVPLRLTVRVPTGKKVMVETDSASVFLQDFQGDVEVASTSGNITVDNMTGSLTLHSNRGNITVKESSGHASIVGNYGALTVNNMRGETAVSTIMGNITFSGSIQAGDSVRLETDHGPVSVHLGQDSALSVHVSSTSGDVACILPGMISTTRTCDGNLNSNGGSLSIRTVSGAVTVQSIP